MCVAGEDAAPDKPLREAHKQEAKKLAEMTVRENEYYEKCDKLSKKLAASMTSVNAIQHDKDHKNNWKYVSEVAAVCTDSLNTLLSELDAAAKKFAASTDDEEEKSDESLSINLQIVMASLMEKNKAKKQVKAYDGNWLRFVNICSASITYSNFKALYVMLLILATYKQNCIGYSILSIRKDEDESKEWPAIIVLVKPVQKNDANNSPLSVDLGCSQVEEEALNALKLNMEPADPDDEEDEPEPYFLNLPGHVCEIKLIHKQMES